MIQELFLTVLDAIHDGRNEEARNILADALRPTEHVKIEFGRAHFVALGNEVVFKPVDSFNKFVEEI